MNKTAQTGLKPRYRLGSHREKASVDVKLSQYKNEMWQVLDSLPKDDAEASRRLHLVEFRKSMRLRS